MTRFLVDSSVLIHLDRIGEVRLLRDLLGQIHVTAEVAEEVRAGPSPVDLNGPDFAGWVILLPGRKSVAQLGLGPGEASLLLAVRAGDRLILDDAQARALAEVRGLEYVGLLGVILAGATSQRIKADRALAILDALVATEFRLAPELYAKARRTLESIE